MKATMALLAVSLLLVVSTSVSSIDEATDLGFREDTQVIETAGDFCPDTQMLVLDDGDFENGYCWRSGGVVPPDYGSFAECYDADYVCGVQFLFTQTGYYVGQPMDVYLWESNPDGNPPPGPDPGNVICVIKDVEPGPPAFWPSISTHDVKVCCATNGPHFVGFWGHWPGANCAYFIASDEDGLGGGCPRTKIAPGIGYPTGWADLTVIPTFADCQALGIREYAGVSDCLPTPAEERTWGQVKALYR